MPESEFWEVMRYRCERESCGFECDFYLEDGCEGPRDKEQKPPDAWVEQHKTLSIMGPAKKTTPYTASGRVVVPVPLYAGKCPSCKTGSYICHVDWNKDRHPSPRPKLSQIPKTAGYFSYPKDATKTLEACGEAHMPSVVEVKG